MPVTIELEQNITSEIIGGSVNLTCLVTGHPLPTVEWLKDDELVNTTNERLQVSTSEMDTVNVLASLLIENLEREDNGSYTCQASNEFTNYTAVQNLLVEGKCLSFFMCLAF